MSEKVLTRQEYMRLYMRCRTRGMNIANLRGHDLKVFVSECMESEVKANRQRPLTKDEKFKRATKLITKSERREKKPQKRRIGYINVTPRAVDPFRDFFINPSQGQNPKEELREFMSHGKIPYKQLMKKIEEIEQK